MESKKRERSANFTNAEVQLLVSLVEKYKQVIENKKTDAVTNRDKECAWKKIESSFNSCGISTIERSWKTLKLKYEGVKKATKKKSSVQRQEMYRTGGGPSNATDFTDVEEKVLSICSNIKGLESRHDSDTIPSSSVQINDIVLVDSGEIISMVDADETHNVEDTTQDMSANINIPDMNESFIFEQNKNDDESQKENKWDRWHPKALKTRVSSVLKRDTVNKSSVTFKLDKLSSARLELVQLQLETARKEQQFKEEEHSLKMLHLAQDEKRKQEIHAVLLQKLNSAPIANDIIYNSM